MNIKKIAKLANINIFTVTILLVFTACVNDNLTIASKNQTNIILDSYTEDLAIHDFKTASFDHKQKKWDLMASAAYIYEKENYIKVDYLYLRTYNSNQEVTTFIESDQGRIDNNTQNIELISNVVAKSSNNIRLKSDYFLWNNTSEILESDTPTTIIRENGDTTIAKNGVIANKNLEKIILKQVEGYSTDIDTSNY